MIGFTLVPVRSIEIAAMAIGIAPVGCTLPPGGVDRSDILAHVAKMAARLEENGCDGSWMMVASGEVVGLISYHDAPKNGAVEIGYGVAESRRRRGFATRAIAEITAISFANAVEIVIAETDPANIGSTRALQHNGFVAAGTRIDDEDGLLAIWHAHR